MQYAFFKVNANVIIEKKSESKMLIRNTIIGEKMALKDKTDIKIITIFFSDPNVSVEQISAKIELNRNRIMFLFKKLENRKFLVATQEYDLFD